MAHTAMTMSVNTSATSRTIKIANQHRQYYTCQDTAPPNTHTTRIHTANIRKRSATASHQVVLTANAHSLVVSMESNLFNCVLCTRQSQHVSYQLLSAVKDRLLVII